MQTVVAIHPTLIPIPASAHCQSGKLHITQRNPAARPIQKNIFPISNNPLILFSPPHAMLDNACNPPALITAQLFAGIVNLGVKFRELHVAAAYRADAGLLWQLYMLFIFFVAFIAKQSFPVTVKLPFASDAFLFSPIVVPPVLLANIPRRAGRLYRRQRYRKSRGFRPSRRCAVFPLPARRRV